MNQQQPQKPGESRQGQRQDDAPRATPDGQEADPAMQGEGNRTAARRYNEETSRVEQAAREARPAGAEEARDLERAEAEGKSHARGEDPLLRKPGGSRDGSA